MRSRDLERLAASTYDVLVVGGGIHGLTIAYEAASRGLSTALVEAVDYGSGISFNHQRTAHGGLRSLQSGRLDRARHAIYERRALARIGPWLLRPLPFLVGTYRLPSRSRTAFRAAFRLDKWLGRHRNVGVEPELHLPAPRLLSRAAALRLFPGIRQQGLTGAAQWYDYQMVEADRLTFAFAAAADRAGADLANYVEAVAPVREGTRIAGMQVADRLGETAFPIRARMTVNAAGARAGQLAAAFGVAREIPLIKAANLVTSRRASDIALAALGANGRLLTLVPWHGRALIGTLQSRGFATADASTVTSSELDAWLAEVNEAFPALALARSDVTLVHRGTVPAVAGRAGTAELKPAPEILDHTSEGADGALTVIGVKYTTARGLAERVVNILARRLQRRISPSKTATTVLPGAGIADHEALSIETCRAMKLDVPLSTIGHLMVKYGEGAATILRLAGSRPDLLDSIAPESQTLGAEIVHAIRHEQAIRLPDILVRRAGTGALDCPSETALQTAARIAGTELGWNEARRAAEIEEVLAVYRIM